MRTVRVRFPKDEITIKLTFGKVSKTHIVKIITNWMIDPVRSANLTAAHFGVDEETADKLFNAAKVNSVTNITRSRETIHRLPDKCYPSTMLENLDFCESFYQYVLFKRYLTNVLGVGKTQSVLAYQPVHDSERL